MKAARAVLRGGQRGNPLALPDNTKGLVDEIKTHQRGPTRILRSKSPEMVKQEILALLLTHYCIRHLMCRAADEADVDPDRLSFIRSLRVIRRQVTNQADFPPNHFRKARTAAIHEILEQRHERRHRTNSRAVKRYRHNDYPVRKDKHGRATHDRPPTIRLRRPAAAQLSGIAVAGAKVISGFAFRAEDDNPILDIGVQANEGSFDVFFADNNPGDSGRWNFLVNYAILR